MITDATLMAVIAPTANSPPTTPTTADCELEVAAADVVMPVSVELGIAESDVVISVSDELGTAESDVVISVSDELGTAESEGVVISVSDELGTTDDSGVFDVKPVMVCCMCIVNILL